MKIIKIVFLFALLTSCTATKPIYDTYYKGEPNYKSFYVVDTIKVENPIIIRGQGKEFVCSKSLVQSTKINKKFFNRPDVFILGDNFYCDLYPQDYKKYTYFDDGESEGHCEEIKLDTLINKIIRVYKYKTDSVRFILCLINANYYNNHYNTFDAPWYCIMNKDQKNSYYKIVYPLCE